MKLHSQTCTCTCKRTVQGAVLLCPPHPKKKKQKKEPKNKSRFSLISNHNRYCTLSSETVPIKIFLVCGESRHHGIKYSHHFHLCKCFRNKKVSKEDSDIERKKRENQENHYVETIQHGTHNMSHAPSYHRFFFPSK